MAEILTKKHTFLKYNFSKINKKPVTRVLQFTQDFLFLSWKEQGQVNVSKMFNVAEFTGEIID